MAKEKENNEIQAPAETGGKDKDSIKESHEKSPEHGEPGPAPDPKKETANSYDGSKKWILFLSAALILALSGLGIKLAPDFLHMKRSAGEFISPSNMNKDNLREQNLSPFFIPPSAESSRGAVRIDLSVIWDGLASIRFNKKESLIRDKLYRYISETAERTEDLNTNTSSLEEGVSRILSESLGVRDLVIKIREIKYF